MSTWTWLLSAAAVLGVCLIVILIERGIDKMFDMEKIDERG